MKKLTTKEFIEKAVAKHGDRYDYSKSEYSGRKLQVKIICKIHGDFNQTPENHLSGSGCTDCHNNGRLTTQWFIDKSISIHGDRYGYDMVTYVNTNVKVKITCHQHGVFEQSPNSHIYGQGCPVCGGHNKLDTESFIDKAKLLYADRYDYSLVDYKLSKEKIKIICKNHGVFEQSPGSHLSGRGCPDCANESCGNKLRKSLDWFIKKATTKHNGRYGYSLVEYKGSKNKVKITCKTHGVFMQVPSMHLRGSGCPSCSHLKTGSDFLDQAVAIHGSKYNYSCVEYTGSHVKVKITCKEHGEFMQSPNSHLNGNGCPSCGNDNSSKAQRKLTCDFISEAIAVHGNIYDYSIVEYAHSNMKVDIICSIHGVFKQKARNHLDGKGCPCCATYGFDSKKPSILYYIKFESKKDLPIYKIGVTNGSDVKDRIRSMQVCNGFKATILDKIHFKTGLEARSIEQLLHKEYSEYKYMGDPIMKNGNTELFTKDVMCFLSRNN